MAFKVIILHYEYFDYILSLYLWTKCLVKSMNRNVAIADCKVMF
jgi:hypothetical protein